MPLPRKGAGLIETVDAGEGKVVHVRLRRQDGGARIEILALESIGMVEIPRSAVAPLRAALKRLAAYR